MRESDFQAPWVVVQVRGQPFALPIGAVRELVALTELTTVARAPARVRGLLRLRDAVLPVVDLRICLGLPTATSEADTFCALMEQREQDHRKWLAELEASVREHRPFTLTTNPHQCAFGRWYDTYKSESGWINQLLAKFDAPHQAIHAVGAKVEALKEKGSYVEAATLVEHTRTSELSAMLKLFADLRALVRESTRETLVVLSVEGTTLAVSIDAALAVERLGRVEPLPYGTRSGGDALIEHMARRANAERPVMLIEPERLLPAVRALAA